MLGRRGKHEAAAAVHPNGCGLNGGGLSYPSVESMVVPPPWARACRYAHAPVEQCVVQGMTNRERAQYAATESARYRRPTPAYTRGMHSEGRSASNAASKGEHAHHGVMISSIAKTMISQEHAQPRTKLRVSAVMTLSPLLRVSEHEKSSS